MLLEPNIQHVRIKTKFMPSSPVRSTSPVFTRNPQFKFSTSEENILYENNKHLLLPDGPKRLNAVRRTLSSRPTIMQMKMNSVDSWISSYETMQSKSERRDSFVSMQSIKDYYKKEEERLNSLDSTRKIVKIEQYNGHVLLKLAVLSIDFGFY